MGRCARGPGLPLFVGASGGKPSRSEEIVPALQVVMRPGLKPQWGCATGEGLLAAGEFYTETYRADGPDLVLLLECAA